MATTQDRNLETSLNIPSIVAFALISFFAIRYFFFSPTASGGRQSSAARRVDPARIDQVMQMFPQLERRDVEWDLVRNGGSVTATTEKVLRLGRLDRAPPSFRAQEPPRTASSATGASAPRRAGGMTPVQKQQYADLITRYNLMSRVESEKSGGGAAASEEISEDKGKGKEKDKAGWSQSKTERQTMLRRRREEMVLAARRKMEEKDRAAGKS